MSRRPAKRTYRLGARAESSAQTGAQILVAARELFWVEAYDEVTLQAVADKAGVALKTVLRRFGSKEALLLAVARAHAPDESRVRSVPVGDVRAVARTLAGRYEQTLALMRRIWPLEERIAEMGEVLQISRRAHLDWLAEIFAPFLPRREGALRQRRLAALFAATELYVWHALRRLGHDPKSAEAVMVEQLEALVAHWSKDERT